MLSETWTLGDKTINRMGFGAMRLTVKGDRDLAIAVLQEAVALGVNHIDTAAFYFSPGGILDAGSGPYLSANDLIRRALHPYPADLVIATKVGPGFDSAGNFYSATTASQLRAQVEENLRTLDRDYLDLVNLRVTGPGPLTDRFMALAALRDEGLIRHLGISAVTPAHLAEAQAIAPVVCVQNSYSIDARRTLDSFVDDCGTQGVAFVPFFAIAGNNRESGATTDHSDAIRTIAAAHNATPAQIRLAWTLHRGPHVLAIPGTSNISHLRANIAAASIHLSPADLALLT